MHSTAAPAAGKLIDNLLSLRWPFEEKNSETPNATARTRIYKILLVQVGTLSSSHPIVCLSRFFLSFFRTRITITFCVPLRSLPAVPGTRVKEVRGALTALARRLVPRDSRRPFRSNARFARLVPALAARCRCLSLMAARAPCWHVVGALDTVVAAILLGVTLGCVLGVRLADRRQEHL